MISYEIPVKTVSEANSREHWAVRAKRAKLQRGVARLATGSRVGVGVGIYEPTRITLTRIGKRRLDTDNLARALKAVRDGIADALGVDDGDDRLDWQYKQAIGKVYSVQVEITKI